MAAMNGGGVLYQVSLRRDLGIVASIIIALLSDDKHDTEYKPLNLPKADKHRQQSVRNNCICNVG